MVAVCASKQLQWGNTRNNLCVHPLGTSGCTLHAHVSKFKQVNFTHIVCCAVFSFIYNFC